MCDLGGALGLSFFARFWRLSWGQFLRIPAACRLPRAACRVPRSGINCLFRAGLFNRGSSVGWGLGHDFS